MEKEDKVRMICENCLNTKILPKHKTDPQGTRFIISVSCPKCHGDGDGLRYFDISMNELSPPDEVNQTKK